MPKYDPGLKNESMDVQDFEVVGQNDENDQNSLIRSNKNKGEDNKKQYGKFVDKMKKVIDPFKNELLEDQNVLKRLHSNLVDENSLDNADLRYKISSMKYELMKKEQQIGNLHNKIKSFSEKMGSLVNEPGSNLNRTQILLLKKELELIEESDPKLEKNRTVLPLNLDENRFEWLKNFTVIYLNTCFHVISAVLIVIMMTIYYSRDSYWEKRIMISFALLIYAISTAISIYALVYKPNASSDTLQKSKLSHFRPIMLFIICLGLCVSMVVAMARRYEDASTFVLNMICLIGFCCAINLPLAFVTCKIIMSIKSFDNTANPNKVVKPE